MTNDWNADGRIDSAEMFINYQIYKDVIRCKDKSYSKQNYKPEGKHISGFDLFLILSMGIVLQGVIYAILGINLEEVPSQIMIILWFIITSATIFFVMRKDI